MWQPTTKQTVGGLGVCVAIQYALNPTALAGYAIGAAIFAVTMVAVTLFVALAGKLYDSTTTPANN